MKEDCGREHLSMGPSKPRSQPWTRPKSRVTRAAVVSCASGTARSSGATRSLVRTTGRCDRGRCQMSSHSFRSLPFYVVMKSAHITIVIDFLRKKGMKMSGRMMTLVWQTSAMSYLEITLYHFHDFKKSFQSYILFLFFSEMNRPYYFSFLAAESMSVGSTKGPFCKIIACCSVQHYSKRVAELCDEKPTTT